MASERKPRLCLMTKEENGYGFHLHGEKGKSGQFIRKVEPGSPAEASGLRPGDRVVAVNGVNVEKETHHQVVQRIKAVDNETRLLVVDHETHESLRSLRLTATEEMAVLGTGPPPSSSPPVPPSPSPSLVPSSPSKKRENGSVSKQPVTLSSQVQKPTRRSPSKAAKKLLDVGMSVERRSAVAWMRIDHCAAHTTASPANTRQRMKKRNKLKRQTARYSSLLNLIISDQEVLESRK